MNSRLPIESDENSVVSAASAASAFQSALAQQVRPGLGWDPVTAMASLDRNILQQLQQHHQQQQQQQQQQQNSASINSSAAAAVAAAAAAGLTTPTSMQNIPAALWQHYGFQASLQQNNPLHHQTPQAQPPAPSAQQHPALAASLASLNNPAAAATYLNHLTQNLQNPDALMSLQQDLLLLEQIQQQRQMLAANPHLLMAAAQAAQASSQNQNLSQTSDPSSALAAAAAFQSSLHHSLLSTMMANGLSGQSNQSTNNQNHNSHSHSPNQMSLNNNHNRNPSQRHPLLGALNGSTNSAMQVTSQNGTTGNSANNGSILTSESYNSHPNTNNSLSPPLTNQDSLVDQHFRRSLGDDYNQIMAKKQGNRDEI